MTVMMLKRLALLTSGKETIKWKRKFSTVALANMCGLSALVGTARNSSASTVIVLFLTMVNTTVVATATSQARRPR
jgi:hypothetical protein